MFLFIDIGHRWKALAAEKLYRMGYTEASKEVLDLNATTPPVAERPLREWREEAERRGPSPKSRPKGILLKMVKRTLGLKP